MTMIMISI